MKLHISRDSVCAGDDVDAPHTKMLSIPDGTSIQGIIHKVVSLPYLANIAGGKATWIATSNLPLAVIAQQWPEPRFVNFANNLSRDLSHLDYSEGTLHLHFEYLAQQDPDITFENITNQANNAP